MAKSGDVTADAQLLASAEAWAKKAAGIENLVKLGQGEKGDTTLFALIATRTMDPVENSGPAHDRFRMEFEPGSLQLGPSLVELGRRIFFRAAQQVHGFICTPNADDKELRKRFIEALISKDTKENAFIAGTLVAALGMSPAIAGVVAVLLLKFVVAPAVEEICASYDTELRTFLGLPKQA